MEGLDRTKMKKRHLKTRRKTTWTNLRAEIQQVCDSFDIPKNEFSEVNINHWAEIEQKVWQRFSTHKNSRWIWETLRDDYAAIAIDYEQFELKNLIPSTEKVWFLLNETVNELTKFWVYEGTVNSFNQVFEEVGMDEIIIVSKKYEWLLIINHHDVMIGTGDKRAKIEVMKQRK